MKNLEELLRSRVGEDTRSATAVIDVRSDCVRLLFGTIGGHGRIILAVEGNEVRLVSPTAESLNDDEQTEDDAGEEGTGVRRPVDIARGEYVDDNDPLKPGENPLDALARIENEGFDARQPEAVTAVETIVSPVADAGADGQPSGLSEIKNPIPENDEGADAASDDAKPEAIDPNDYKLVDLKKIAADEGVELDASDNSKAEVAAKINAKRGV